MIIIGTGQSEAASTNQTKEDIVSIIRRIVYVHQEENQARKRQKNRFYNLT